MTIAFWVLASFLALAFLAAGSSKLIRSRAALLADPRMAWANDFSGTHVKLIGLSEVLGAFGLILPPALHFYPVLSPISALCLAALMSGAAATHIRRKESPVPAVVLAIVSLAVAAMFHFGGRA